MKQIYRQIFFSTTKYVLLRNFFMVITGIVSIFIVRLLGPSEYGKYSFVWNLISTVGPVLSLGWLNTLAKFIPERVEFKERARLFSQSFFSVLVFSVVFFVVILIINKFFPQVLPVEIKEIILVFSLFTILVAFFNIFEGFWRGLGKFNQFVIIDGLRSNIGNILGLVLLIFGFLSYKTVILANFFISIIFLLFLSLSLKNYLRIHIGKIENQIINFALSLLLGQFIYMLSVNLDVILLRGILRDTQQVGYYTAGIRIPKMIETMFIAQLPAPILYYFSSVDTVHLKEKMLKFACKMLGFIFGIVGLICFTFARFIVLFLFGNKFEPSILVFKFFSLTLPLLAFLILISPYYFSENKPFIFTIFHFLVMVLIFNLFNLFLIPQYKSFAPVVSYLISLVLFSVVIYADCYRRYRINLFADLMLLCMFLVVAICGEKFLKIPSFLLFIFLFVVTKTISLQDILRFLFIVKGKLNENT